MERVGSKRFEGILFTAKVGDHEHPIHLHAKIGSAEVIVVIGNGQVIVADRDDARRGITRTEVRKVLKVANREIDALLLLWKEAH